MLTENQIQDAIQAALGRQATPYELKTYATASPLTIANLKNDYSKLNIDTSISDFLKSVGQDNSLENRTLLGQQYGINGIGTAEGNTSLLQALKGGAPVQNTVGGAIIPQSVDPNTPITGSETGATVGSVQNAANTFGDNTGGGADTSNQPPKIEGVDGALKSYQSIQKQIGDIDNSLATMLEDRKKSIAQSGGIVNESQLKSEILREQAPLLEHRRELATQQAQAGKMYTDLLARQKESDANFFKTQAANLAEKKQKTQESQFEQSLAQRSIKYLKLTDPDTGQMYYVDQSSGKVISTADIPEINQPTTATGDKTVTTIDGVTHNLSGYATDPNHATAIQSIINNIGKLNTPQDITNYISSVVPNSPITAQMVQTASQKYGVDWETIMGIMQQESQFGTAGVAVKTNNPGNVGNTDNGSTVKYPSWQDGVNAVAQWVSNSDKAKNDQPWSTNDASLPPVGEAGNKEAFWVDPATNKAIDTGRSINYIFQSATTLALDKSATVQKFLGGINGSSGVGKALKNAISNKAAALMAQAGVLPAVLQQEFAANTKAINTQVGYLNTVQRALNGADVGAQKTQKLFKDKGINTNDSTWANKTLNDLNKAFGSSADIRAYQAAMIEIANEYAQVFARGGTGAGTRTVEGTKLANDVINGNVKLADIQKTFDTLQSIGQTVIDTTVDQVRSISSGGVGTDSVADFLGYVYGGNARGGGGSQTGGGQPQNPADFSKMSDEELQTYIKNNGG